MLAEPRLEPRGGEEGQKIVLKSERLYLKCRPFIV